MQQHTSDNQTADAECTSSVNAPQAERQQLQVVPPAGTAVKVPDITHQGDLYEEAMQNLQSPQSFHLQVSTASTINPQQQMTDWTGDGRFVQPPVRYSSTLQPVYDIRGQFLTPANIAFHPANVNHILQYSYGSPQHRPNQGPVAQFTPWQTIFTPNQGLAWVPGGIQTTTIEGQGNQILSRNLQHDSQAGMFIHNGQSQLQQLKQMDGQNASIPKNAITENFSPTLPNSIGTVSNMRTQQHAQIQALQTMQQSHKFDAKVLTKNSVRMTSSASAQKNGVYHTNSMTPRAHPLPPVHGSLPDQTVRAGLLSNAHETKRMKQSQAAEESSRKDPTINNQQPQKRYQQTQGNLGSATISVKNGIPATLQGVTLSAVSRAPILQNKIPESATGVSSAIQVQAGQPVGTVTSSTPVITTSQQQLEKQNSECKKRIQQSKSSATVHDRSEERHASYKDLGKHIKERSNSEQKPRTDEVMDVDAKSERDNNDAIPSKAMLLVKPQIMSCAEGSMEPVSSYRDVEDAQMRSEADGKIFEHDGKELNGRAVADSGNSGNEVVSSLNKQEAKPNISKWTVADVYEFIKTVPGCSEYAEDFVAHDIDGEALMLLKTDHLVTAMSMTLGPAMKIISRINAMREDTEGAAK